MTEKDQTIFNWEELIKDYKIIDLITRVKYLLKSSFEKKYSECENYLYFTFYDLENSLFIEEFRLPKNIFKPYFKNLKVKETKNVN